MTAVYIILGISAVIFAVTVTELIILTKQKAVQSLPHRGEENDYSCEINGKSFENLYLFLTEENTDISFSEEEIYLLLKKQSGYMSKRFDCSDFRAQLLFKIYIDCSEKLSEECKELIKNTFLGFKYFMDEPGEDSMCYWSENHQILFAAAEYLAGQQWQNEVFTNDKKTGAEHMCKAEERINAWMKQRYDFGFSEYLSNNYLAEDISAMANIIAYCKDRKIVARMKIIMDMLWLDVALNSVNNRFVAVSPRMYGNNKAGNYCGNSLISAMNVLWGNKLNESDSLSYKEKQIIKASLDKKPNYIVICFTDIVKKGIYVLPEAIRDIALSKEAFSVKMNCGLSPSDLVEEGLVGQKPHQIMAQLGAEAFTNPQVISNTIEYVKSNKMYRNSFVGYFKYLSLTVLKPIKWDKFSLKHNTLPHGIALGRGNVYTYRNAHYSLSTDINKDVDMCGAQDHIWTANIEEMLTVFTTHPSGNGNNRFEASPGYWIGNGRRPMSVQYENVNITVYRLPEKRRLGETDIAKMTHAYMPECFYDEFQLSGNMLVARKNGVFVAMISNGELTFREYNEASVKGIYKNQIIPEEFRIKGSFDLCRFGGDYHIYITELSDVDKESFEDFKKRIRRNSVNFEPQGKVNYSTACGEISVSYSGDFFVNNIPMEKNFDRYDCKFCKAPRKPDCIFVDSGKSTLSLDYMNIKREMN